MSKDLRLMMNNTVSPPELESGLLLREHGTDPRWLALSMRVACLMAVLASHGPIAAAADPARFENQIVEFEQKDQAEPTAPGQILFVGSSSVRLWDLKASFPTLDAINRGFGGSVIADSVHFFPRIVAPAKPRQVVLYAGDNDLASGSSPQQVLEDFKQFVSLMNRDLKGTPLVFIAIKPSLKRWNLIEKVREANALIKAECEKDPLLTFVDLEPVMLNDKGEPRPELFAEDGLHLSAAGYQVWKDALKPHLIPDQRATRLRTLNDHYHPWTPPETLEEWKKISQEIREQVLVGNGLWPMPEKGEFSPVIHGLVDRGDYTIERVYFRSLPGHYVTGSLYRPKHVTGKIPAVLCPHGHWSNGRFQENSAGEANSLLKSGAEKYMSGARFPVQARMVQLARMGCVVFHYDMVGVADNGPLSHREGFCDADAALWLHNKMGLQTWNSIRAIDFVTSLPDVDSSRIGITGASGGGTQTFLAAAVDPRVTVAFPAVMVSTSMQGGCVCENADYLRTGISNIALAALTAPRPMAMSGANDWTIDIETKGFPELRQVYALYGEADLVSAKAFPQFPHNYNQPAREMMYDWMNTHLQLGLKNPIQQTDFWPLTQAEMTVFDSEHPRPEDSMGEAELRESMRTQNRQQFEKLLAGDPTAFREMIRGARGVLFPALDSEVQSEPKSEAPLKEDKGTISKFVVKYDKARVPVTLVSPAGEEKSRRVVLWLDGAGKSHLQNADGTLEPAVKKLLESGVAVASADLLLTGDEAGRKDFYASYFEKPSPSHHSAPNDKEYTGFVYGYNLTPMAERLRDIEAVVLKLREMKFEQITLAGTSGAGVWTLLARADLPADLIDQTIVDLNGFTFSEIKLSNDPNMVPGALKYGGVGGLATSAFPAKLTVHGTSTNAPEELAPLTKVYESEPESLKTSTAPLTRDDVVNAILSSK
ncbi:GDSL-type esterase/lipase family protein [Planctomicrobium sp. SH661]|uniref:GDSL-type esterase/lipase family protein n=1 Tax=Planctomicrobium sp. SH661 TaxID=3448124 RepID=UPI003F5B629D